MASAFTASPELPGRTGGRDPAAVLEAELVRLERMGFGELKETWRKHFRSDPPVKKSREILRLLLGWKLQERVYGGLDPKIERRLRELGRAYARDRSYTPSPVLGLRAGTELIREWQGQRHSVRVHADGFEYQGRRYGSLSEIARQITGTRWSGPLFFGLKKTAKSQAAP